METIRRTVVVALSAVALVFVVPASATVSLTQIGADPYTNPTSQHSTAVEPDSFSFASTIVATFQLGRFTDGGASNIGWATSTNGGASWTSGVLPGITKAESAGNPYDRASDPSVAYDARHNVWLISSLPLVEGPKLLVSPAVVVSRSTDGGLTWSNPVTVASATGKQDFDKNWTACDNTPSSGFYGRCYTEYDDFTHGSHVHVAYSADGGLTWSEGSVPPVNGVGGQPVVQPSGTVVMPVDNGNETRLLSLRSTNGGASWSRPVAVASIFSHAAAGGLRSDPLPSAAVDGAGTVYVAWHDCRFRQKCAANDIVLSTSADGVSWSPVARVPIDGTTSGVDHFIPGLGVDPATSGSGAHLGLAYYYYPSASCSESTCELDVGFVSSTDGGATWSSATQLAGPMTLTWLPATSAGRMVGDYISTSFTGGTAHPVFAVASAPSGGSDCATATPTCDEPIVTTQTGLVPASQGVVNSEPPLPNPASDHAPPQSPRIR